MIRRPTSTTATAMWSSEASPSARRPASSPLSSRRRSCCDETDPAPRWPGGPDLLAQREAWPGRAHQGPASLRARSQVVRVSRLYLCWRDLAGKEGDEERRAEATLRALPHELKPICPEVLKVPWKTASAPTDHAAIRPFAEDVLRRARAENPDAHIYIHVSAGTPAMHAVWLGPRHHGLRRGSGHGDRRHRGEAPRARRIASRARQLRARHLLALVATVRHSPEAPRDDDDGQAWDPSRVRSPALRATLAAVERYAPLRAPRTSPRRTRHRQDHPRQPSPLTRPASTPRRSPMARRRLLRIPRKPAARPIRVVRSQARRLHRGDRRSQGPD